MKQKDIFVVSLDPTVGAEMQKSRPCLIISPDEMNLHLQTVQIAPMTSTESNIPTRVKIKASKESGLKNDSFLALDQIKTIDKSRLGKCLGRISDQEAIEVSSILIEMFSFV